MKRRKLFWCIVMVLSVLLVYMTSNNTNAQETIFSEDFEGGWGDWYPDNGVWEVGEPTAGPGSAHGGLNCVGTVLAGNYPAYTDSRLIYNLPHQSGIDLPEITGDEELHLRFWHWYSYSSYDYGYIQIQVQDGSDWETVLESVTA